MNMQRTITKTSRGFRVYGLGTCVMDLDANGNVIYSNLLPHALEYQAMHKFWSLNK